MMNDGNKWNQEAVDAEEEDDDDGTERIGIIIRCSIIPTKAATRYTCYLYTIPSAIGRASKSILERGMSYGVTKPEISSPKHNIFRKWIVFPYTTHYGLQC